MKIIKANLDDIVEYRGRVYGSGVSGHQRDVGERAFERDEH
jgi:hypothetical protein